ncbi:MAG: DegT/DnrJ/EryC1/StrS family aminotransferase [Vicinamibacterales bacterium]
MQAAVGVAQLEKVDGFIDSRRRNFDLLFEALSPFEDRLVLPTCLPQARPAWFGFPLTTKKGTSRSELVGWLEQHRIETRMLFGGNVLRQPGFRDIPRRVPAPLTQTDVVMENTFFIGVYPGLTDAMIDYVVETFRRYFATH